MTQSERMPLTPTHTPEFCNKAGKPSISEPVPPKRWGSAMGNHSNDSWRAAVDPPIQLEYHGLSVANNAGLLAHRKRKALQRASAADPPHAGGRVSIFRVGEKWRGASGGP